MAELLLTAAQTQKEDIEARPPRWSARCGLRGGCEPREGAITLRDLVGKLTVLRIECEKCGRSGQYRFDRLIMRYGIDAKPFEWSEEITADCPRKHSRNLYDQCGARCPDLPKVV